MSEAKKERITCPHCQYEGEFDLWNPINVDFNPKLGDKIFDESLWNWTCPHCGETIFIAWGTRYLDMRNKFIIFFSFDPDGKKDEYASLDFSEATKLESEIDKDYTIRVVYGLNYFKEKILILRNNLDDIAIERMKYMTSHYVYPFLAEKGYELYFKDVDYDDVKTSEHGSIIFTYKDLEKNAFLSFKLPMDDYYEHCLAVKIDPRMRPDESNCVNSEWIEKQLKLVR